MIKRWYFFKCSIRFPWPHSESVVHGTWSYRSWFANPKKVESAITARCLKDAREDWEFTYQDEDHRKSVAKIKAVVTDLTRL